MSRILSILRLLVNSGAIGLRVAAVAALVLALGWTPPARGQQQQQGTCARVKIVIAQQLTLERIGFEATLEVGNNDGQDPVTDFSAALTFEDPTKTTPGAVNDASSLFFVQTPTFDSINSVSGDGVIQPSTTATVKWFIIPKIAAGGTSPDGLRYKVGCRLAGKMRGVDIPPDVMQAIPAQIFVKPDAQLDITYFQPRDVQGDDPFTPEVESPVPFTLGVIVKNSGYGPARKVKIDSQQPKIVENKQNLLLIAQLLGARVNDQLIQPPTLTVDLGDIQPNTARKGAWDMITSLSGEFIEFKASYTHASELGGQETSLIRSLNAYFISHEVLNDQPGRDSLKDFLTITTNTPDLIPDTLYESEGNVLPVNYLTNAAVVGTAGPGGSFQVTLTADRNGWGYIRLTDPGQAKIPIASVTRSDGKILNTNNFWTNYRYEKGTNQRDNYLNVFDLVDLANYTYTVTYAQTTVDTTPPVTTMRFAGSVNQIGGAYYITPDTQMYFTVEDASPVSIFYSVTNGPFLPAYPFSLPTPGQYPVAFYSVDSFNNREATKTNLLVVAGSGALDFASASTPNQPLFASGDAVSIRPYNAPISFQATVNPSQTDARLDIFQGVIGWATVAGVPSSPTADSTASLTVGGDYVDLYRYSLNGGAWSAERPVSQPIALSGLSPGTYNVAVLGRSIYGVYLDNSNAVTVSWVVSPTAPATRVTGTPATPSRLRNASLNVAGTGVTLYRWSDGTYYRAEAPAPGILAFSITTNSPVNYALSFIGKTNGVYQSTNVPTTVSWLFDPLFGYSQPGLPQVRSVTITNVGSTPQSFVWDGRSDAGAVVTPGWYTVRITLADQLGRTNFTSRLVQVGQLAGTPTTLADPTRGPKNPYARGHWTVWQDQSDGNWEIYAQSLVSNSAPIVKLTNNPLNQENPRTDGRYLVWQGRQTNGNWDVFLADLASPGAPQPMTSTANLDEINPTIEWPWLVYQRRSSANPSAAWQLVATNLVTAQGFLVSPSPADELDPDIQAGRLVWQDWRDAGPGEIYFKNLETGEQRRITTNTFGQYHPAISGNWIVWQDTRNTEVDLYGFDLLRNTEVRVTSTPENETRPFLEGPWAVCQEDSLGPLTANLRLIHLPSLNSVPITRTTTFKDRPALAMGKAVWLDTQNNYSSVLVADLPVLQGVFQNRNVIPVTAAMASYQQNAYNLLTLWNAQAGVQEITHYVSLVPTVTTETATWNNGAPAGQNFQLTPGTFLWVKFSTPRVLDLGVDSTAPLNLVAGANVVNYSHFPGQYSAFRLLQQLGPANVRGVRMLDAESGRWVVANVQGVALQGNDFAIPSVAVLLLDLVNPVSNFTPQ